jgi:hypothetical protein
MSDDDLTDWDKLGYPKPAQNIPSKQQMRDVYRTYWLPKMMPLLQAQEARALGLQHFMLRDPESGEWRHVEDPKQIEAALNHPDAAQGSTYRIHTKDPDGRDITDILNRVIDKPKEQEQEVIVHDGDRIRERLEAWKREHRKGE